MVTGVAAGAVRAAGGISTSRGVGIAVVCAAAALATATAASTAAWAVAAGSFVTMVTDVCAVAIIGPTSAIVSAPASPAIPSACPSIVPLVVAMVTVACMPKTVAGVGIIGFGAGMSLAASDISDSDGAGVTGVAGVPGTPECCAVGTASTSS